METPPRKVCAVCGRTLDIFEAAESGDVTYLHTLLDSPEDHPSVPIDPGTPQDQGRCDFCSADLGRDFYVLPMSSFEYGVHVGHVSTASAGDWAACTDCGRLLEQGRWSDLLRRAVRGWEQRHGMPMLPEMQQSIRQLYARLRKDAGPLRNASS